jgi:ubiquinone/menaquinone biosynthesis C-methylase UbiE
MHTNTQKKFISPESVLFQAGLKAGQSVADLGAGSGHYAIAAAKIVGPNGTVYVVDVKDSALEHVVAEARLHGIKTIKTFQANLEDKALHTRLPEGQCAMVIMSGILHEVADNKNLIGHAYKLLQTGGRLVVVDWNDKPGAVGPAFEKRVNEVETKKLVESSTLRYVKNLDAGAYHFGMVFEK